MSKSEQGPSKIRSSSEMFPVIEEWKQSGLSQKEFCKRHGLKPHILCYWRKRYEERDQSQVAQSKGFVSIEMDHKIDHSVLAEVIYSDGTRLIFKERVRLGFLQGLLSKQ